MTHPEIAPGCFASSSESSYSSIATGLIVGISICLFIVFVVKFEITLGRSYHLTTLDDPQ
jgi:hypothetical protein